MDDVTEQNDTLDQMFDEHWDDAVDQFAADGEDEEAFQAALRAMVRSLQRRAYFAGANDAISEGFKEEQERLSVDISSEDAHAIVRAMLYGHPLKISLNPA